MWSRVKDGIDDIHAFNDRAKWSKPLMKMVARVPILKTFDKAGNRLGILPQSTFATISWEQKRSAAIVRMDTFMCLPGCSSDLMVEEPVVAQVYEQLARAGIGPRRGIHDCAAAIAVHHLESEHAFGFAFTDLSY